MHYVVEVDPVAMRWPTECPYCRRAPATETIPRKLTTVTGFWVVAVTYQTRDYLTPACHGCASANRLQLRAGLALLVGPWLLLIPAALFVSPMVFLKPSWAIAAGVTSAVGVLVLAWREYWLRCLRMVHIDETKAAFATTSEPYGTELSAMNGVSCRRRVVFFWE